VQIKHAALSVKQRTTSNLKADSIVTSTSRYYKHYLYINQKTLISSIAFNCANMQFISPWLAEKMVLVTKTTT